VRAAVRREQNLPPDEQCAKSPVLLDLPSRITILKPMQNTGIPAKSSPKSLGRIAALLSANEFPVSDEKFPVSSKKLPCYVRQAI
jgi:hypothetical protein